MLWLQEPDVIEAFAWFDGTHELTADFGRVYWRRLCLPLAGGYGDQDARTMAAIEYVRDLRNAQIAREMKKPAAKDPATKD